MIAAVREEWGKTFRKQAIWWTFVVKAGIKIGCRKNSIKGVKEPKSGLQQNIKKFLAIYKNDIALVTNFGQLFVSRDLFCFVISLRPRSTKGRQTYF